jgi:uncharacterized ferritin-like protein (DUF455 family)
MNSPRDRSRESAAYLLKVLLRFLRQSLLESRKLEQKIDICDSIQDTAHAISHQDCTAAHGQTPADCCISPRLVAVGKQVSATDVFGGSAIEMLLACLDGQCSAIQLAAPQLAAVIRRAIETTGRSFGLPASTPCHIDNSDGDLVAASDTDLAWRALPVLSGREEWSRAPAKEASGSEPDLLRELHGNLFGIEVCAAEVCAAMPLRFPELPLELDLSLARQTYEEGRHARLLLAAFKRRGGGILDYEPSQHVWRQVMSGRTLVEMLCIEQLLGEGHSLGSDLLAVDDYERNGQFDLAQIHLSLHADEMTHVALGTTWVKRLAGDEWDGILVELEPQYAVTPPPDPCFRTDLRRQAGFTEMQIGRQRERMLAGVGRRH